MKSFEKILARYGSPVTIFSNGAGEGVHAMALIQPIRDRERQDLPSPWAGERKSGGSIWVSPTCPWKWRRGALSGPESWSLRSIRPGG